MRRSLDSVGSMACAGRVYRVGICCGWVGITHAWLGRLEVQHVSDELTARMEDILERFRYTPLLIAINQCAIEDVREVALLQIVVQHSLGMDVKCDFTIRMWCNLLGDAFSDLAKERQVNPLPVETIYLGNVKRYDYAECARWACEKIIECMDGIAHMESML